MREGHKYDDAWNMTIFIYLNSWYMNMLNITYSLKIIDEKFGFTPPNYYRICLRVAH